MRYLVFAVVCVGLSGCAMMRAPEPVAFAQGPVTCDASIEVELARVDAQLQDQSGLAVQTAAVSLFDRKDPSGDPELVCESTETGFVRCRSVQTTADIGMAERIAELRMKRQELLATLYACQS